ncbi:hypothetical protein BG015_007131 [Linnemannia schmuckeri]|uniref:F-box domain-containing protein n=1 Tax=Linnemannia schmuckeri TaxID=64567 RepID=A0A9P5S2F5_9FUNG|nr:hypothetical protein BG015_007131 [Linnemannia schmuckeri]
MNSFERTTVFEIPLLLDMICQHLTPSDFQNCSRVNRVLFHAFQPHLWKTFRLLGEWYPDLDTITTAEEREGVIVAQQRLFLEKSAWVRSLEYDQWCLPSDLNPGILFAFREESRCRSLLELSTTFIDQEGDEDDVDSLFVEKPETNEAIKERNVFAAEALGALLDQNTRLNKCEVNLGSIDSWVLPVLMEPLKRHPYLRELRIAKWTHFHGPVLERLLKHLPPTLEVLWLNWEKVPLADQEQVEYDEPEMSFGLEVYLEDESEYSWPELFPAMQEVHLMGVYSGLRGPHILRFLQRCLHLHTLTWPGWPIYRPSSVDPFRFIFNLSHLHHHQGGSRIKHLTFNLGAFDDTLNTVLPGPSEAVETLRLARTALMSGSGFLQYLTTRWCDTLTVLEFGSEARVLHTDTLTILQSCPHLIVYRVESTLKPACIPVGTFNMPNADSWVCHDLQVLQISFLDYTSRNGIFSEDELTLDPEDLAFFQRQVSLLSTTSTTTTTAPERLPNRRKIRRIYRQLGALTRLQTLTLGSQGPYGDSRTLGEYYQRPITSLDMSLESGLYHLKNLVDLRVLNVGSIKFLNVGADEIRWMQQNWPNLRQICGLSNELQEKLQSVVQVGSGLDFK